MAKPTFTKLGVPTVTLSRAATFPSVDPIIMNQFIGVSDNNVIRVASLGPARQILSVELEQLNALDITNLTAFFRNPLINWGLNSFNYTDSAGIMHTVRYLQSDFSPQLTSDDNYSLNLTLTVI